MNHTLFMYTGNIRSKSIVFIYIDNTIQNYAVIRGNEENKMTSVRKIIIRAITFFFVGILNYSQLYNVLAGQNDSVTQ